MLIISVYCNAENLITNLKKIYIYFFFEEYDAHVNLSKLHYLQCYLISSLSGSDLAGETAAALAAAYMVFSVSSIINHMICFSYQLH